MTQTFDLNYEPLPTLLKFHKCSSDIRAMVGPVGSGKTTAATLEVFYFLPLHIAKKYGVKKTKWAILRNTYRELADTVQKTIFEWFPWGDFKSGDQTFTLKYPKQGIEVEALFRSCDRPDDVKKFKSLEITGYWIDESIEVKNEIKLMLKNRIGRYPAAKYWPLLGHEGENPIYDVQRFGIETTNPPDVEHPTYYNFEWKTHVPGPEPERKEKWQQLLDGHVGFWQPPYENARNLRKDYYTDLIKDYAGNPDWIARYVKGEPGITVTGKPVYWNFRKDLHVSPQSLVWSKGTLYGGWDNTGNCPAFVVVQVPTAGIIQVLAEYHTERMGIVDFVEMVIADRNKRWPDADWVEWGDPAGEARFSKKGGGLTSNAELMKEAGITLKSSEQNWEARRESVESQMGKLVAGEPALLFDPSCLRLINGLIGGYCYPEIGTSGVYSDKPLKNKFSHVHDALQYVLVMLNRNVPTANRGRKERNQKVSFGNWKNKNKKENWDGGYQQYYVQ